MRRSISEMIGRFLQDLMAGDSVAWIIAGVILGVAAILLLLWWKIASDLRRDDERHKRRLRDLAGEGDKIRGKPPSKRRP